MKKGTKVSWKLGNDGGNGVVISDEDDGHVLVRVEGQYSESQQWSNKMHYVIHCAVTWLTVVQ